MRGNDSTNGRVFSYLSPEERVPRDHPLRSIREVMNGVLEELSPLFESLYSQVGRPSVPPEQLLRALLIQVLYSVRSERMLIEQLDYNLLFRWFVGLSMDDPVWDATTFSKNRDRLLRGDVARELLAKVVQEAHKRGLMSEEHFTVDGTLLKAWASQKSFLPTASAGKGPGDDDPGNPSVDFHGEKRSNKTHRSKTDPDSRLYRKSANRGAELSYMGHVLAENANGLVAAAQCVGLPGKDHAEGGEARRQRPWQPGLIAAPRDRMQLPSIAQIHEQLRPECRRGLQQRRGATEQFAHAAQFGYQAAKFGVALQLPLDQVDVLGIQGADDIGGGEFFSAFVDQSASPSCSRSLSMPRRILAFTVPSGCSRRTAISLWLRPARNASSMTWRWSEDNSLSAARMRSARSRP